ncbi:hypothetical protein Pcar_1353 [Syntrophotalea carbinolica DSM 2380]|uniref:Phosphate-starvation-inducible E-like protein n=1 Tax=Syntrophotalea carbinolica (strain DSM 2380 / NBRC 103641 / GraBd1) TaxID=338963 RepID=Q3A4V6_SYNC1|nr:phosphate-starvation-inducible PsiE family protein [Syntrophotalea carbinolica]ABA88601.1 hypothetical protein Pcar_1353 [Syntrophotalea carbinolica DSM 2380]
MEKIFKSFEKTTVVILLVLMMLAVAVSTIELAIILYKELMKPPFLLLSIDEMIEVFSFFLMVLIGLELVESVKAYLEHEKFTAEIVILVALVAVSRKIIILNYEEMSPEKLLGISAIIISLGGGFYLLRKSIGNTKD